MGMPVRELMEAIGGGARPGRRIKAVLPGMAQGLHPGAAARYPVSCEGLIAIGSGVGSTGFVVLDDTST